MGPRSGRGGYVWVPRPPAKNLSKHRFGESLSTQGCGSNTPLGAASFFDRYARIRAARRRFTCVTAVASHVSDVIFYALWEDDRLGNHFESTKRDMFEEIEWMCSLPSSVWVRLARHIAHEEDPDNLRIEAILAANKIGAYIDERLFRVIEGQPFCLGRGDFASNLQALAHAGSSLHLDAWGICNHV